MNPRETRSFYRLGLDVPPEALLRRTGCSEGVIRHCRAVAKRALFMARRLSVPVDTDLLYAGAMIHDIGRSRAAGLEHVPVGAAIAGQLGLHERLVRIVRTHVGAGLTAEEAKEFGLPPGDYMPRSPEEKIVAHADNLTRGETPLTFPAAIALLEKRLGPDAPAIGRIRCLRIEILSWTKEGTNDPEEIPPPGHSANHC